MTENKTLEPFKTGGTAARAGDGLVLGFHKKTFQHFLLFRDRTNILSYPAPNHVVAALTMENERPIKRWIVGLIF